MNVTGLALALVVTLAWGVVAFITKFVVKDSNWLQGIMTTSTMSFGMLAAVVAMNSAGVVSIHNDKFPFVGNKTAILAAVAYSVSAVVATVAYYYVLDKNLMSVSELVVVSSIYPVITVALAFIFLGERMSALQFVGTILAIGGIILVSLGK